MKGIRFGLIDFLKIICIAIIGISNSFTLMLIFTRVFKNLSMTISSIALVGVITLLGVLIFIKNKKKASLRKENNLIARDKIMLN